MTSSHPLFVPARPQTTNTGESAEHALVLLGPSSAMAQLWAQIRRLAAHVRTMLLTGESDCGQEAIAHLLLDLSSHPRRSFLHLTAAEADHRLARLSGLHSLPSELFLFLPDVHKLSTAAQDGLLRLFRIRRTRMLTVVAATSEDLRALAATGRFSSELAEILSSVRVSVPSLRQRPEDIPMLLAQMFSAHMQPGIGAPQITDDFLRAALQHTWPGNLREISGVVSALLADQRNESALRAADLQRALAGQQTRPGPEPAPVRMVPLDTVVLEHIYAVLRGCRGNKLRAAEVLGISRSTLYRMLDSTPQNPPLSLAS